jgi:hypothetical protein
MDHDPADFAPISENRSCTQQLWAMAPIGAAWTESMQLGAEYQAKAQIEYYRDIEVKNAELSGHLGACVMRMRFQDELVSRLTSEKAGLERELALLRDSLAQCRSAGLDEQDALAREIWVPLTRKQPDATWDQAPVLLSDVDSPITVGGVASEMGFQCTAWHVHRLSAFVREAYLEQHKRPPVPVVYCDRNSTPDRISCYTERDRELIRGVVARFGER